MPIDSPPRKHWVVLAVLAVLVAFITRVGGLADRGVYYCDEAAFMCNARFYSGLIAYAGSQIWTGGVDKEGLIQEAQRLYRNGGTPSQHGKPLFYAALIVSFLVFGESDSAALGVSAFAGVMLIAVLGIYGLRYRRSELIYASVVLSVSLLHIHYSRAALSQSLSILISTWVLLVLYSGVALSRNAARRTAVSILAGIAFLSHYNLFWLPPVVLIWIIIDARSAGITAGGIGKVFIQTVLLMALPAVLVEVPYSIVMSYAMKSQGLDPRAGHVFTTYFEQLYSQATWGGFATGERVGSTYYPSIILKYEGIALTGMFVAGLSVVVIGVLKRSRREMLLLSWIVIPFAIWSIQGFPAPRSYAPILPVLAITAGCAVSGVSERVVFADTVKYYNLIARMLVIGLLGVSAIYQISRVSPLMEASSPYALAAHQIREAAGAGESGFLRNDELSFTTQPIWRWYLGSFIEPNQIGRRALLHDLGSMSRPRLDDMLSSYEGKAASVKRWHAPLEVGMIMEDTWMPYVIRMYDESERSKWITYLIMPDGPVDVVEVPGQNND